MQDDLFRVQEIPKKSLQLHKSKQQEWVEASFVDPEIQDEYTQHYGQTDGYLGRLFTTNVFRRTFIFALLVLCLLSARSAQLQIVQGATYLDQAEQNRLRIENLRADRGLIYDRFKVPLVQNIPNYTILLQPSLLPSDQEKRITFLKELYQNHLLYYREDTQEEFLVEIEEAYNDFRKRSRPVVVANHLKQDDSVILQIRSNEVPALSVELLSRRHYLNEGPPVPDPEDTTVYEPVKSLSHLLGYMSSLKDDEYSQLAEDGYLFNDVIGRTGLEYIYEKELRGVFGKKSLEVNAQGNEQQVLTQSPPEDGQSLLTTIDSEFQRYAESRLQYHLDENEKKKGSIVVMNPQNGQILAMVSLPTFDNNDFAKGISSELYSALLNDENNPLFNRSVSGEYPSGSTFKPIVAAAALEESIVSPYTPYLSTGGIRIKSWFFPDWRAGGHGQTNVYHALADSVNTYFYIIGGGYNETEGLGVARISAYAKEFGLSEPLGIDLPGEGSGFLPSKEWKEATKNERWYIGDTYHLAIGQGDLLVTPLQVASFFSSFANDGVVYQPTLVSGFLDKDQNLIRSVDPVKLNEKMISPENMTVVQDGLRRVVTQGSGKRLGELPFAVSGKTGTAQWHSTKAPHAWFGGYAPTENPQIAFSVLVEEGEEGSKITVSVTKDLLEWWYENRIASSE